MLLLGACSSGTHYPRSFTTDGCSSFPDGPGGDPDAWRHHCVEHDRAYWAGGTREQRKLADRKLADGLKADGHTGSSHLIYWGTRMGGHPLFPASWRWGYAWEYPRGYRPLTGDERAALAATQDVVK